jgi:three-Cys-motif partner protein
MKELRVKQQWGGSWTEKKLDAFESYVKAYLNIMNKNPYWKTIYFDGFAGSGEIEKEINPLYLKLELPEEEESVYKGAAERITSLNANYKFDYYYFIEKKQEAISSLESKIKNNVLLKKSKYKCIAGNCNEELKNLAEALHKTKSEYSNSKKYAALILLDPFGMQIDWESISNLKDTKSDVWILLPTAIIVNRLLDHKGELKYTNKLQSFFGLTEQEIREYFYIKTGQHNLFESEFEDLKKVYNPIEKIADLYIKQLKTIWAFVSEKPLRLESSNGRPLFHFVFASNNKSAVNIAKDIILKKS